MAVSKLKHQFINKKVISRETLDIATSSMIALLEPLKGTYYLIKANGLDMRYETVEEVTAFLEGVEYMMTKNKLK